MNRKIKNMEILNKKIKKFLYLRNKKIRNKINMENYITKLKNMKEELLEIERKQKLLPNAWIKLLILKTVIDIELRLMKLQTNSIG